MGRTAWSLVVAALVACGDDGARDPGPALGVYSEFLAYTDVTPTLPALAERGADLNLAVPSDRIGTPDLATLLRAAEEEGVRVRIWLVVARDDGYWPNEENATLFAGEVTRLLDWLDAEALAADAIVYDMEPGLAYSEELRAAFADSIPAAQMLMSTHLDAAAFAVARDTFTASVRAVQARGRRAVCVTYPQVVDDALDADDDFQDAMDIPVREVPFDEVAFMVYQTAFAEQLGAWIGPSLIAGYARDARTHYGDRAVIALGQVGAVGIFTPTGPVYEDPAVLGEDVAAARAEGIERVEVYSLDGMQILGGAARWMESTRAAPEPGGTSSNAMLVRTVAESFDTTLGAE